MPEIHGDIRIVDVHGFRTRMWLDEHDFFPHVPNRAGREEVSLIERIARAIEHGDGLARSSMHRLWGGPLGSDIQMLCYYAVKYSTDLAHQRINVPETIKKFQQILDIDFIGEHGPSFFRTTERNELIRGELKVAARRLRAIYNCKTIKEDLMAAVWHPRRVEHILENYGWDAYENLLGV
jgi:hypothetical protein